jgi:uncharacterized protein
MRIARRAGALAGLLLSSLLITLPAAAAPAGAPYPKPAVCLDQAAALDAGTCARITQVLGADEKATGDEIAVAIVQTTGGASIETWGTGLFNAWGVGKRDRNNGVLLVIAVADHRLRIVTGRGLTTRLPDGTASEIVGGTITPLMRAGRTQDAVLAGLDGIRRALGHDVTATELADPNALPAAALPAPPASEPSGSGGWVGGLIFLSVFGLIGGTFGWRRLVSYGATRYADVPDPDRPWWARQAAIASLSTFSSGSRDSSSGWSSGSSSGSSGSSGGGSSGGGSSDGGGASGSW